MWMQLTQAGLKQQGVYTIMYIVMFSICKVVILSVAHPENVCSEHFLQNDQLYKLLQLYKLKPLVSIQRIHPSPIYTKLYALFQSALQCNVLYYLHFYRSITWDVLPVEI